MFARLLMAVAATATAHPTTAATHHKPARALLAAPPAPSRRPVIPEGAPYLSVPHGALAANPARIYRAVFDARAAAGKPGQLAPAVQMAAGEINTFAAHGLGRGSYRLAIVFHTTAADEAVLSDARYRARHKVANPNLRVLSRLKAAGVQLYVDGQQPAADHVPASDVSPDIMVADDGLVAIMTLGAQGFTPLIY